MCIINAPLAFRAVWGLVKPMLQPRTINKITILGTKYIDDLTKHVAIENIPEYMGGTSPHTLLDDAGPWNDPQLLSTLNMITEDKEGESDASRRTAITAASASLKASDRTLSTLPVAKNGAAAASAVRFPTRSSGLTGSCFDGQEQLYAKAALERSWRAGRIALTRLLAKQEEDVDSAQTSPRPLRSRGASPSARKRDEDSASAYATGLGTPSAAEANRLDSGAPHAQRRQRSAADAGASQGSPVSHGTISKAASQHGSAGTPATLLSAPSASPPTQQSPS